MEEEKIIQGPQKLHTESPAEIEDMLTKKVGGNFSDASGMDSMAIHISPELELEVIKLQETTNQKVMEFNTVDTLYPTLTQEERDAKKDVLFNEINGLGKQIRSLTDDQGYRNAVDGIAGGADVTANKNDVHELRDLMIAHKKALESLSKQMSGDYKKLEKYQEDLDQTQEDITRLRAGVDVDFSSRGMTEKLSIEEKINLLNTDFEILSERIPILEKSLHENQTRMNALVNIINPEAKTS